MKKIVNFCVSVAFAVSFSGYALGSETFKHLSVSRTLLSGEKSKLGMDWHINLDCKTVDFPATHVIEAPRHGRLMIVHESLYPDAKGQYAKCRSVKVRGLVAYYTSQRGFIGHDHVILRSVSGIGVVTETVINITVVQ